MSVTDDKLASVYQKKTDLESVLESPGMYIGSINDEELNTYVYEGPEDNVMSGKILQKKIIIKPALCKIVDEGLVNAADINHLYYDHESMPSKSIDITMTDDTMTIRNSGPGIAIAMHPEHNMMIPELIMSEFKTSTNNNKDDLAKMPKNSIEYRKSMTGGKHGYGAKLIVAFSDIFIIETVDISRKLKFTQTYRDQLSKKDNHVITSYKNKSSYTSITFKPCSKVFGDKPFTGDTKSFLIRRFLDIAMSVSFYGSTVTFNGNKINMKGIKRDPFSSYVSLYNIEGKHYYMSNDYWHITIISNDANSPNSNVNHNVSFVNAVNPYEGGTHISYIINQICNIAKGMKDGTQVTPTHIRKRLSFFIDTRICAPDFEGQTKYKHNTPVSKFGNVFNLDKDLVEKIIKDCGILKDVKNEENNKDVAKISKKINNGVVNIPKLIDPLKADTKESENCYVMVTEGDSPFAAAKKGLSVLGNVYYGAFPLRGKFINPRKKSQKDVLNNKEVQALMKIFGLKMNTKYKSLSELRVGHLMMMSDQDHDGKHITGLVVNFIDFYWPELLTLVDSKGVPFFISLITPVAKIIGIRGAKTQAFESQQELIEVLDRNDKNGTPIRRENVRYYKGLGSNDEKEMKTYFRDLNGHLLIYNSTEYTRDVFNIWFAKLNEDERKKLINEYAAKQKYRPTSIRKITYEYFFEHDFVEYAYHSVIRGIPCITDGFKASTRKLYHLCSSLKKTTQVLSIQGDMINNMKYHNGDSSIQGMVITFGKNYIGSNNVNILIPIGEFGTREKNGDDAASARYLSTNINPIMKYIFLSEDNDVLEYNYDAVDKVEFKKYYSVSPFILYNGADGTCTGFKTEIHPCNPVQVVEKTIKINNGESLTAEDELEPYYRGFTGSYEVTDKGYLIISNYDINGDELTINELAIGISFEKYKEYVAEWRDGLKLDNITKNITNIRLNKDNDIIYSITFTFVSGYLASLENIEDKNGKSGIEQLESSLHLTNSISKSSMYLFDDNNNIRKYNSINEIITEHYNCTILHVERKRLNMIKKYKETIEKLNWKMKFIHCYLSGEIRINKDISIEDIEKQLSNMKFPLRDDKYDYLISLPLRSLTKNEYNKLKDNISDMENKMKYYENNTAKSLYNISLVLLRDELIKEENKFLKEYHEAIEEANRGNTNSTDKKLSNRNTKVKMSKQKNTTKIAKPKAKNVAQNVNDNAVVPVKPKSAKGKARVHKEH